MQDPLRRPVQQDDHGGQQEMTQQDPSVADPVAEIADTAGGHRGRAAADCKQQTCR